MKAKTITALFLSAAAMICAPVANALTTGAPAGNPQENAQPTANPIAEFMTVEPVGLYEVGDDGQPGNLYLVLKVTNHTEKQSATFGSSIKNQKMLAVDAAGNVYGVDTSGAFRHDTPQDVPVKVELIEQGLQFMCVPQDLTTMSVVKIGINIDANRQGNLTFKNVPIIRTKK